MPTSHAALRALTWGALKFERLENPGPEGWQVMFTRIRVAAETGRWEDVDPTGGKQKGLEVGQMIQCSMACMELFHTRQGAGPNCQLSASSPVYWMLRAILAS